MARKLTLALVLAVIGLGLSAQTYTTTSVGAGDLPDTLFTRQTSNGVPVRVEVIYTNTASGTGTVTWTPTLNIPAQTVDADGVAGGPTVNVPATSNVTTRWVLDGFVYVNSGNTLTIQPGSVVWGETSGSGSNASVLIVTRGARIVADGTAVNPIIMTRRGDDVSNNNEALDRSTNPANGWAGLVILGNAPTNLGTGQRLIEGAPTDQTRATYGTAPGDTPNPAHDGGIVRYVSIRNTGKALESNSELQGLTLGACGTGTIISYVESIFSADDGIEVFGGTVNIDHFVCAFIDDDMFDFDQGWSGRAQFLLGYQFDDDGNRGCEWDGDDASETTPNVSANGQPYAQGQFANMTVVGNKGFSESQAVIMRNNAAYTIRNSIFVSASNGFRLGSSSTSATIPTEYDHLVADRLNVLNCLFADIGSTPATTPLVGTGSNSVFRIDGSPAQPIIDNFTTLITATNTYRASGVLTYPATGRLAAGAGTFNPIPGGTSGFPAVGTLPSGFATANYIGAFDPATETASSNWASWTFLAQNYIVGAPTPNDQPQAPLFFESYTFGPNPTSGTIFVRMQVKQSVDAQFDLINVNGQVLRTKSQYLTANGETQVVEVDANGLGNGVYFLRSRNRATGDLLRTDRVVKQ
ncbi:MAG: T9SS type A sorting domain-containing protein [Bacteroidia bacterium]|nr:T9SS type A sorting domain-containing protein [Bacteroidia bacterium]